MKDDDICGVSLSIRFNVNMVALWNRKAPHSLPSVAPVGNLPFTNPSLSVVQEEDETSVKKLGIENMKDFILAGLPPGLMPQRWSYRVCVFEIAEIRCTAHIRISINNPLHRYGRVPVEDSA
jgi:hypothetical protein